MKKSALGIGITALITAMTFCAVAGEVRIESAGVSIVHEATLAAQEAGILMELEVSEGEFVKKGAILARQDDRQAKSELIQARIKERMAVQLAGNDVKLRLARTALKVAEMDLKRAEESNQRFANSVTDAKLDRFRLAVEQAMLDVEQAKKEMETSALALEAAQNAVQLAEVNVERRYVLAPIDGQVVEVKRHQGEWLQPGDPVVRILQTAVLRAEAYVPLRELAGATTGREVRLLANVPGRGELSFQGVVTFVSPEVNPVDGQVQIWAEMKNHDGNLRPGMLGTLVIPVESGTNEGEKAKDALDVRR